MSGESEHFKKGLAVRRDVLGKDYVDGSIAKADDFMMAFQEITTEWCWGYAWTRPGLDRKTRSMLNLAMLTALKARGIPTGILSNGDPDMLAVAVKSAGLDDLLDHVISVDSTRKYKTHPDAYALGPQTLGLEAKQIAFVSCNGWDALAATWYGFRTLWVNRYQLPFEELGTPPTRTGTSLRDVLSFF